jgi:hypothetical protein
MALVVVVAALCPAQASAAGRPDPHRAAKALVASLRPGRDCNFAASKVVSRQHRLWLAVGTTCGVRIHTRLRVFRWSGRAWRRDGLVTGPLGPSSSVYAASLTASGAPDFAIEGCGAGDTICTSIVSKHGGRWHAVPFEYGYGRSLVVNGVVAGHLVLTTVNACGCAGGPTTQLYERYSHDVFVPARRPGRTPSCSIAKLERIVDFQQVRVLRFTRVGCADGWALAVGDGVGFDGPAVALFELGFFGRTWHVLTLDNGSGLPAAPALYDVPLSLLARLAAPAGATLAPHVAAARLIAGLQTQYHFSWAQQNGIVEAGGQRWLIAVVPVGPEPDEGSPAPVGAVIYRWDGAGWVEDGRIARLSHRLNIDYDGGWFVSVPAQPPAVAFELVNSCCTKNVSDHAHSTGVITDAGGTWHVAPLR